MKLEVGQFIRTNDGYINKIEKVNQFNVLVDGRDLFGEKLNIPNNEIAKSSYNIIDILEGGDYVNGCKVHKKGNCLTIILDNEENISWINPDDIKSIVTKEQYKNIEYRIGE